MAFWLFKQEPTCYGLADLERDGRTTWDGVTNATARIHLRNAKKGDKVYLYHTGDEKAVVGVMEVAIDPKPDPEDDKGDRWWNGATWSDHRRPRNAGPG